MPLARLRSLPYKVLAGVEPCQGGWLVAPGNLHGITLAPRPAFVLPTLVEVLDYRPTFEVIALHCPLGLPDKPGDSRSCDVAARKLLGIRGSAVLAAPSRAVLEARTFDEAQEIEPGMDMARWRSLPKIAEAGREVQSWNQRSVWEVHPELAFFQLNGGQPVRYGRRSEAGRAERAELVCGALPGAAQVLEERPAAVREGKLVDALANLWTSRRIAARAITRMAQEAVWDAQGLRMDIVC